jgi:hypothetical protein
MFYTTTYWIFIQKKKKPKKKKKTQKNMKKYAFAIIVAIFDDFNLVQKIHQSVSQTVALYTMDTLSKK